MNSKEYFTEVNSVIKEKTDLWVEEKDPKKSERLFGEIFGLTLALKIFSRLNDSKKETE